MSPESGCKDTPLVVVWARGGNSSPRALPLAQAPERALSLVSIALCRAECTRIHALRSAPIELPPGFESPVYRPPRDLVAHV